ncbi:MAG: type II CRISPR RNA-guided endonuclease Cas9 [Magnetospirillum sp. WYHS-4]
MTYRLGIDVGSKSIGWCVLRLGDDGEPDALAAAGARIFGDGRDPKKGSSLAEDRRLARSARKRRDRFLRRQAALMAKLIAFGLMPAEEKHRKALEALDPYCLRRQGLDELLPRAHLGRALFHMNQRRGFASNRKVDKGGDDDKGKIRTATRKLEAAMKDAGARTLGEYLALLHAQRQPVRARLRGEGAKAEYDLYPTREMTAREFDLLWETQARLDPTLPGAARDVLRGILLHQRPLKPVPVGRCTLDPGKPCAFDPDNRDGLTPGEAKLRHERAPWALPIAQRFRILKELANLEIRLPGQASRPLTVAQRDLLLGKLLRAKEVSFDAIRKTLKLETDWEFNLERVGRKGLKGDETAARLAHKDAFGKAWHDLPPVRQHAIVERLLADENEEDLIHWLESECGLAPEAAEKVSDTLLPERHVRFGRCVLSRLVPVLEREAVEWTDTATGEVLAVPVREDKAIARLELHHSDRRPKNILPRLPYYGQVLAEDLAGTGDPSDGPERRYGRYPNPTVHIGLNQLRRVVNAVIDANGPPAQVVVELARELKLSREERRRKEQENAANREKNDERRRELHGMQLADTGENRLRLRLWEELSADPFKRQCVYCGRTIGSAELLSDAVEVDHILPFSRTLDNSAANKTVVHRACNRGKTNDSPFEAFGHQPHWPDILARAQTLPGNKRWRFDPDAMDRFENEERNFLDRQLQDTQYLARLSRRYLAHVCDPNQVWVVPGRLTEMLRGKWGLNGLLSDNDRKNRDDHRHHAIDAFVVALTDRSMLQRIATAGHPDERGRILSNFPEPWDGFREDFRAALDRMVVAHRAEHGTGGRLHEDTAYGLVRKPEDWDGCNLVRRKPLAGLSDKEIDRIRDKELRQRILDWVAEERQAAPDKKLKLILSAFAEKTGIRHIRLLKPEKDVVPILNRQGKAYKAVIPGDNHRIEIFAKADGTWAGEAVTVFQANQKDHRPRWRTEFPGARLVMVLHKKDFVEIDHDGKRQVMQVVQLAPSANRVHLVPHNEGGALQERHDDPDDSFRWLLASYSRLKEGKARRVRVDALGRIFAVPPPK